MSKQKPVHCVQSKFLTPHLTTAELEEDVDVLLVFEMMGEFHHMLVRQGFVELDLVRDLFCDQTRSQFAHTHTHTHISMQVIARASLRQTETSSQSRTLSRWWGLDTRLCGITFTAYILLLERSVIS